MVPWKMSCRWSMVLAIWVLAVTTTVSALELDIHDYGSVAIAAATTVRNMFSNSTSLDGSINPMNVGDEWKEIDDERTLSSDEGEAYITLIRYWNATGDVLYNDLITKRMDSKRGVENDYRPRKSNGTCRQAVWGLAAMTAAETNFPQGKSMPSWLFLAKRVFSTLSYMYDKSFCDGGIVCSSEAPNEKDALANGMFFQLAARLAYATTDDYERKIYTGAAVMAWEWGVKTQMLDENKWSVAMSVKNTTEGGSTCAPSTRSEWSYMYGLYLSGAAYLLKLNEGLSWEERVPNLLYSVLNKFFIDDVMRELGPRGDLGTNETIVPEMQSQIGMLASSLATVANLIPETAEYIAPSLRITATAAAKQCSGSENGTVCGSEWTSPIYDQNPSLGNSMSAVNVFTSVLTLPEAPKKTLANKAIVGIAVGSGGGVVLIAAAIFLAVRRHKKNREKTGSDTEYSPCHFDPSQDTSCITPHSNGALESTSELPTSKEGGAQTLRHELDGNDIPVEQHEDAISREITPRPGNR
ncbi:hypothetical protein P170DRAFT_344344 [Aspergillus steynii IBT 23096]|uniref:mannan endo-1,6-alpha-mannosidase n=1 Tax=Aspergillus steynii IBT 23096 TaxID=1392250 RepID=A0A2I2GS45_9EURO|nr:uncharacterized protein P170DRAFT_344344 [Aspergillus steynii IBT 23096]PLB55690.1 hypothetical protein P170DRAFT_344344 [Aspergillus steynii IBT 23096]